MCGDMQFQMSKLALLLFPRAKKKNNDNNLHSNIAKRFLPQLPDHFLHFVCLRYMVDKLLVFKLNLNLTSKKLISDKILRVASQRKKKNFVKKIGGGSWQSKVFSFVKQGDFFWQLDVRPVSSVFYQSWYSFPLLGPFFLICLFSPSPFFSLLRKWP